MWRKLSFYESLAVSAAFAILFTLFVFNYIQRVEQQRRVEWTAIQFVLEDIRDSIKNKQDVPRSWEDVESILVRASRPQLLVARKRVVIDFSASSGEQGRFISPITAGVTSDDKVRSERIEWLGGEISREIERLPRPLVGSEVQPSEGRSP